MHAYSMELCHSKEGKSDLSDRKQVGVAWGWGWSGLLIAKGHEGDFGVI